MNKHRVFVEHLYLLLALTGILSACGGAASPTMAPPTSPAQPTSALLPTSAPAQRATPSAAPTVSAIALDNVNHQTNPDGSINTSAQLSVEKYGLGDFLFTYPPTMTLKDARTIQLTIRPSQQLASLTPIAPKTPLPNAANLLPINDTISIYSVMYAELTGVGVSPEGKQRKDIVPDEPAFWTWLIRPQQAGTFDYTLAIQIPGSARGMEGFLDIKEPLTVSIQVMDVLPIAPTPTPAPSFWDTLANNFATNLTQSLCGLLTALVTSGILGLLVKNWLDRRSQKPAEPKAP
jgi:hypothetical protein